MRCGGSATQPRSNRVVRASSCAQQCEDHKPCDGFDDFGKGEEQERSHEDGGPRQNKTKHHANPSSVESVHPVGPGPRISSPVSSWLLGHGGIGAKKQGMHARHPGSQRPSNSAAFVRLVGRLEQTQASAQSQLPVVRTNSAEVDVTRKHPARLHLRFRSKTSPNSGVRGQN